MISKWLARLFSQDLGIDLGTSNTLIYVRGRGIVLTEPSVVARKRGVDGFVKVGKEAREMLGRTPGNLTTVRPLQRGVIADCDCAEQMIRAFSGRVHLRRRWVRPRVVVGVPLGITQVEKHAIRDAVGEAGAREVYLMEGPLAAAIGAGLPVQEPTGSLVVDIGGGTTEIAVISLAGIVSSRSIRIAGDEMDEAVIQYLKRKYGVLVGERTAENVKIRLGSAYPVNGPASMEVTGRDIVRGVPKTVTLSDGEIRDAIQDQVRAIVDAVRATLEATPAELAADIVDNGMVLTGGGALLPGLDTLLARETRLTVRVAEDPLTCVALGTGRVLEELDLLKRIFTEN
jgi:rod shape-determining protein MreB